MTNTNEQDRDISMNAEIISIGSELLLGQIVDTNASWIAKRLAENGVNLFYKTTVGDNLDRMTDILDRLKKRGLIKRRVSSSDRRIRLTTLTDDGKEMLAILDERAKRAHERTIEALAPQDRVRLIEMMTQIIDANSPTS